MICDSFGRPDPFPCIPLHEPKLGQIALPIRQRAIAIAIANCCVVQIWEDMTGKQHLDWDTGDVPVGIVYPVNETHRMWEGGDR